MHLTFHVPMQYCSSQHGTLLPSPVTYTTGCYFHFGSIPSFFLKLFLHCSPVAYWAPTDLERSSFSVISLCFFILYMGFSGQEYWRGLPFPSPVDHILSELSTVICPSWVALHGMAHGFIQFSVGFVPSLLFELRPNYGGGNEDNLLQKVPCLTVALMPPTMHQATANPHLHQRLLDTHGQVRVKVLVALWWG